MSSSIRVFGLWVNDVTFVCGIHKSKTHPLDVLFLCRAGYGRTEAHCHRRAWLISTSRDPNPPRERAKRTDRDAHLCDVIAT